MSESVPWSEMRRAPNPFACGASAGCGDHVCCLDANHLGEHESCEYGDPSRGVWARWPDHDGDLDPYACCHEEMEHVATLTGQSVLVRCTRCGGLYKQVDDPNGPVHLTTISPRSDKRVRYDLVRAGAGQLPSAAGLPGEETP